MAEILIGVHNVPREAGTLLKKEMKMKTARKVAVLSLVLGLAGIATAGWVTSGNNMYSDVKGNVGIGTTAPIAKLEVYSNDPWTSPLTVNGFNAITDVGGFSASYGGLTVGNNVDSTLAIRSLGSGHMQLATDGPGRYLSFATGAFQERMTIDPNGNVAIGTSNTSLAKLTIACRSVSDGIWLGTSAGGRTDVALLNNCSEGAWNPITRPGDSMILFKSNVQIDDPSAGGLVLGSWSSGASPRGVRITPAGDVGIGVPYPAHRLHVDGYVQAKGYYTGDIFFQKDGQKVWRMFEDAAGLYVESLTTGKTYNVMLQESGSTDSVDAATIAGLKARNTSLEQRVADLEAKLNMLAEKLR